MDRADATAQPAAPLWPHQQRGPAEVLADIDRGVKAICLTSPTGGGKTRMVNALIEQLVGYDGWYAIVYTNRRMLVDQLREVMGRAGIEFGVRAAGHPDERSRPVQIGSIPTEKNRTLKGGKWSLHGEGKRCLAVFDEAHLNATGNAEALAKRHLDAGHVILGPSATPLDLAHLYRKLVVAGTNSELRECGALVRADHYGPDEPDLRNYEKDLKKGEDLSEAKQSAAMGGRSKHLFGRVWDWYKKLNPRNKPTILFAPGVAESRWFAAQFCVQGVQAAHIDGGEVWIAGESYGSDSDSRAELLARFESGEIKVLCNRFVLREGVDTPWVEHMIFATVFGSLQSYLQSGGRGLRASPRTGKRRLVVQDHGGNWWRHGSLNSDREWRLEYTPGIVNGLREERLRERVDREPMRCPRCAMVLARRECPCGFVVEERLKFRPVVTSDGRMSEMRGDIFRPRNRPHLLSTIDLWNKCYWMARNSKTMTFKQAEGLYVQHAIKEFGEAMWPPRNLKNMPTKPDDWFRRVCDVPRERLIAGDTPKQES